ncbi:MAG: hypothetical protein K9L22_02820 [Methylococcaceae bacterium]|nr:hypothetical protein [Methylococcaceae bacterium]
MAWLYFYPNTTAKQLESDTDFSIHYKSKQIQTADDIEILPIGDGKKWTNKELITLKDDLWQHMEADSRRGKLRSLIQDHFFGEKGRVAGVISSITQKNVSARTIQSWLIDLDKPSSRRCPAWAIKALDDYLADPKNKSELEAIAQHNPKESQAPSSTHWEEEAYDKSEVNLATAEIEYERKILNKWQTIDFNTLALRMHELEIIFRAQIKNLEQENAIFKNALKNCDNFDDFKQAIITELDEKDALQSAIDSTRKAIEQATQELSNKHGLYK